MKLGPTKNALHAKAVTAVLGLSSFRNSLKTNATLMIKFFVFFFNFVYWSNI
jgi:hypothetical protein